MVSFGGGHSGHLRVDGAAVLPVALRGANRPAASLVGSSRTAELFKCAQPTGPCTKILRSCYRIRLIRVHAMPTDIFTISTKENHVFDVGARRIAPINEPEGDA